MAEENYQAIPLDEKQLDKIYKEVNKPENREIINLILEKEDVEKDEYIVSVNRKNGRCSCCLQWLK
jgi:hypothetical protein